MNLSRLRARRGGVGRGRGGRRAVVYSDGTCQPGLSAILLPRPASAGPCHCLAAARPRAVVVLRAGALGRRAAMDRQSAGDGRRWITRVLAWHPLEDAVGTAPLPLLWCWLIGCTLLLTVAGSKLATYLWPVFPAVAILAAVGWARLFDGTLGDRARRLFARTFIPSSLAAPLVLALALFVVERECGMRFTWPVWTAAILAACGAWTPLWFWYCGRPRGDALRIGPFGRRSVRGVDDLRPAAGGGGGFRASWPSTSTARATCRRACWWPSSASAR